MAYGVMKYDFTGNLGDEIQSIASRSFLPHVDVYVDRERLDVFHYTEPVKLIMNGWYMHWPEHWPPSPDVIPLLTSLHINSTNPKVLNSWLKGEGGEYLRHYGRPIGARDTFTMELLQAENIPVYFSGCLTLTLRRDPHIQREPYVCAVDVSKRLLEFLRKQTKLPVYDLTHGAPANMTSTEKFIMAETLLEIYQGAQYVVTGRLHAALPCLAYETPVLLIDYAEDIQRFTGLDQFARHCPEEQVIEKQIEFDFLSPAPNSGDYLPFREKLIEQCVGFIGENSYHDSMDERFQGGLKAVLLNMLYKKQAPKPIEPRSLWEKLLHG